MQTSKSTNVEIWDLDGTGIRRALVLNGVVRYVGSYEKCAQRAKILIPQSDRDHQDRMVFRSIAQ